MGVAQESLDQVVVANQAVIQILNLQMMICIQNVGKSLLVKLSYGWCIAQGTFLYILRMKVSLAEVCPV